MSTARDRWQAKLGQGPGIWYGVELSQEIVESGDWSKATYPRNPPPLWHAVKFGGDWGGLWGTPETWGKLSPANNADMVVPYLFIKPETADKLRDVIGGLFADGYPAIILDVEESWVGQEAQLYGFLVSLNLEDNLIGVTGYAWFNHNLWPDGGERFGHAVGKQNLVYLPEYYLANFPTVEQGNEVANADMTRVMDGATLSIVVDNVALSGLANGTVKLPDNVGVSVWNQTDINEDDWAKAFNGNRNNAFVQPDSNPLPVDQGNIVQLPNKLADNIVQFPTVTPTSAEQINTALGQALAYLDSVMPILKYHNILDSNLYNLMNAILINVHTARRLNGGE